MRRMNTRTLVLSSSLRCIDSFWFACRITSQSNWTLNISQPSFLPQARPDLGSWQVLLLFSLFFPGSQAMWEGDNVFAKVWQTASNLLFSVESDSYGISFQRNGIINDHRLIQNSFNWPFLPWTSSSFVFFKDLSFSVEKTIRPKNLDFDHPSLDVWGIGPGFDDTATTFSVCSWLFIYYVVRLVETMFEIISWFLAFKKMIECSNE